MQRRSLNLLAPTFGAVVTDIGDIGQQKKISLCLHQMQPITNLVYHSLAIRDLGHSSTYIYLLVLLVGGETKQYMERLSTSYKVVCGFEIDATSIGQSYKPLRINRKVDLSAGWKLPKKGGGIKKSFDYKFCLCCAYNSNCAHNPTSKS
jgi:hypothetical protein